MTENQNIESGTPSTSFRHGYALLIGVNENQVIRWALPTVVNDVNALQKLLVDPQHCAYPSRQVEILTGTAATKDGILAELKKLKSQSENDPEATVVIYFSGHGWRKQDKTAYSLIPYNLQYQNIEQSSLSAELFSASVQSIPAKKIWVILDCCHAGGMAEAKELEDMLKVEGYTKSAFPTESAELLKKGQGRAIFSSSTGDELSYIRSDTGVSWYTHYLCEALEGKGSGTNSEIRLSDVMGHVTNTVSKAVFQAHGLKQTPYFDMSAENFIVGLVNLKLKSCYLDDPTGRNFLSEQVIQIINVIEQLKIPEIWQETLIEFLNVPKEDICKIETYIDFSNKPVKEHPIRLTENKELNNYHAIHGLEKLIEALNCFLSDGTEPRYYWQFIFAPDNNNKDNCRIILNQVFFVYDFLPLSETEFKPYGKRKIADWTKDDEAVSYAQQHRPSNLTRIEVVCISNNKPDKLMDTIGPAKQFVFKIRKIDAFKPLAVSYRIIHKQTNRPHTYADVWKAFCTKPIRHAYHNCGSECECNCWYITQANLEAIKIDHIYPSEGKSKFVFWRGNTDITPPSEEVNPYDRNLPGFLRKIAECNESFVYFDNPYDRVFDPTTQPMLPRRQ